VWGHAGAALRLAIALAVLPHATAAQTPAGPPPADSVVELKGLSVSVDSRLPGNARTRAVTVLDRDALDALPATTILEALRWGTGVDLLTRSPAQADVAVRGGTFEQVLVLVDGVPVSDAQTGHFDLNLTVPLDGVERIEVLRGAGSSVHGADAMGGIVNVVTRSPGSRPSGRVRLEGGTFGRAAGSLRLDGGAGDWRATASGRLDRSDGHREGVDHDVRIGQLRLVGPLAGGRLDLRAGAAARDFGADGFYAPFPSYEETRGRTASARWVRPLGEGGALDVVVHDRTHDDDFVLRRGDPAFYRNVHTSRQSGVDVTLRRTAGSWGWLVGAGVGRDDLESTNLGDRAADRGAIFGEAGWTGPRARVRAGLRLDGREEFAPSWAPSLSAGWTLGPRLGLRAAVARSFRTPTWTDRYYEDPANRGDPNLAVETAWSGEAGLDWTLDSGSRVRLTAFVRDATDLIDYARRRDAGDDAVWQSRNVESARFTGVEVDVVGVALGPARLDAGVELLDVSTSDSGEWISKYALRPLTRAVTAGVRTPLVGPATLAVRAEHRRRSEDETWTAADVRVDVPVGPARLWLDASNVGDARWLDVSGLRAPGRAFRTGVSVDFGGP
jgi:iron complex outermembrane receptor protein